MKNEPKQTPGNGLGIAIIGSVMFFVGLAVGVML